MSEFVVMISGQQFGRYEIRSKLGEGGMGEVYAATDSELGRSVAIKLLPTEFTTDPDRRGRFRQEARVVSALNHPNILTIYEIGENEHGSFLATEYVEGRTVRDVIKNETLSLPRTLRIIEQAANALVAAHAARIVHRDIKPENIMLRHDAIVKVLDFGLAKPNEEIIRRSDTENNKTVPGTVMGSARYMSPEQARGQDLDERTDIWSLGVVLYEMLAGHAPFDGESTAETLAAVIYKDPEAIQHALPNAPLELQRILRKALQKDRDERYQSVKDFALDVKDLLYDLEHVNSGDRVGHTTSSPEFSENPTIIHRTISANHPTNETAAARTARHGLGNQQSVDRKILKRALIAALSLLVLSAAAFGVYSLFAPRDEFTGAAFEKTQVSRINSDGKAMQPAISPDGRYIAYVNGELGSRSIVIRQIATNSTVTVVPETNLNLHSITFSPDGDFVYYCETRSDHVISTLYQVPTLGGKPKKLIEDVDSAVTFSRDGKRFAFMRHVSNNNSDNIFIVDAATLSTEPLFSTIGSEYTFFSNRMAWSPDGRRILLGAGKRQSGFVTRTDIAEILVDEKIIRRLNPKDFFWVGNVVWLDDGLGFLFTGKETMNSHAQIWRSSFPAWSAIQVTNDFNDYQSLSISADGRSVVTGKGDTSSAIWRYTPGTKASAQVT
ncbi:MAG: protein kinase, partial [Acidobacteria bacterium]|nr:protein kinase [Acidobacteriota bacterium]